MKKITLIPAFVLTAAAVLPATSKAEVAANIGWASEYLYRGIFQEDSSAFAGIDYTADNNGFYIGTWASSIKWIKDGGGDANAEVDLYGGYKFTTGAFGLDVGLLRYLYPGSSLPTNPDTTEVYVAGTFGPATLKYSHAVTNLFGFNDSKNSYYVDLNATFETGFWGLTFTPHIGYQRVAHNSDFSYTDWSLGLGKDFGNGFSVSLAYVDTNTSNYIAPNGKDLGKATAVLGAKYTYSF